MIRFWTLALIAFVSQAAAWGQVSVTVNRHTSTGAITEAEVDRILKDGQSVLQNIDGPTDVAVNIAFQRRGPVGVFVDGTGDIDSPDDHTEAHAAPGNVKIVRSITWCRKQFNGSIFGCSKICIPQMSIVVVRIDPKLEGILWMHEYGHNQGLPDSYDVFAVMSKGVTDLSKSVSRTEANAFVNGCVPGTAAAPAVAAAQAPAPADPVAFVRRVYPEGVPYETASQLPRTSVPVLLRMLDNPEEKFYWTNIVTTLGFIGDEQAVKPLMDFVRRGDNPVDDAEYRAKRGTLIHLGDLIFVTKNKDAYSFLKNVAVGEDLRNPAWLPKVDNPPPISSLQVAAVMGLSLSGQEDAGPVIQNLSKIAAERAPKLNSVFAESLRVHAFIRLNGENGLKAYRLGANR